MPKISSETHPSYRPPIPMPAITFDDPLSKRNDLLAISSTENHEIRGFVANNLLTSSECSQIIDSAESLGLQSVEWEYHKEYRDCSRVVMRSKILADTIYKRVFPLLSRKECECARPFGFDGDGDWRPYKVNDVIRISRYDEGGKFLPHRDGAFVECDDLRSVFSVVVYLNGTAKFTGGCTKIFPMAENLEQVETTTSVSVNPTAGNALILLHDIFHAGEDILSGHKYIARFDIMFKRLGGGMTKTTLSKIRDRNFAEELYASSIKKQREGDAKGSTEDYVAALELQAKLPSSTKVSHKQNNTLIGLDDDSVVQCLRFLIPLDISILATTSKYLRYVCSDGLLWRELFLCRWPVLFPAEDCIPRYGGFIERPVVPRGVMRPLRSFPIQITVSSSMPSSVPFRQNLYHSSAPANDDYMFNTLRWANFGNDVNFSEQHNWCKVNAKVCNSSLQLNCSFPNEKLIRTIRNLIGVKEEVKEEETVISVPINKDTKVVFGSFGCNRKIAKMCVISIGKSHLCIQIDDSQNYFNMKNHIAYIFEEIAKVMIAHQTYKALGVGENSGDPRVLCEAKTKQWKTAYRRRHVSEKFFDVVTVDVGSLASKMTSKYGDEDKSFVVDSVIRRSMGHLWSAGHGLKNYIVGGGNTISNGTRDFAQQMEIGHRTPYKEGTLDVQVMGIICAHLVEKMSTNRLNYNYRVTCAEYPINVVEPAFGFHDGERAQLCSIFASFDVPFIGFVNGAVAALACGRDPCDHGIVVMLGGSNSTVSIVSSGAVLRCTRLGRFFQNKSDENEDFAVNGVCVAINDILNRDFGGANPIIHPGAKSRILLTGGNATDSILTKLKERFASINLYVASVDSERHLDAVRGGQILANMSDSEKYFSCILNSMWTI